MASIDGVVFEGIDTCPYAAVSLLTPSGQVVAEQTANHSGEFRFVVPSGVWGIEAKAGEQKVAVRDVMAFDGERFPIYVCLDSGERRTFSRKRPARSAAVAVSASKRARVLDLTQARNGARQR